MLRAKKGLFLSQPNCPKKMLNYNITDNSPRFLSSDGFYGFAVAVGQQIHGYQTTRPSDRDKSARVLRQLGPYEKTTRTINNYCCLTYFF